MPAGAVDVVLTGADGKELARQTVSAAVGQKTPVALDAQPPPPPPAPGKSPMDTDDKDKTDEARARAAAATTEAPPPSSRLRPYAYIAGGVGIAGLATFANFALMDKSTYGDLQNACPNNVCPPGKQGEVSSGRTQQTVANVGLVVGAVGVAAGATLFFLSPQTKSSAGAAAGPSARLLVGPGYLGVGGNL